MRVLFVKTALGWPRTDGSDLYCYYMMKALGDMGVEVGLVTSLPSAPQATVGLSPAVVTTLDEVPVSPGAPLVRLSWAQERFRSFWGIAPSQIQATRELAASWKADAVVAFALPTLPYLAGPSEAVCIWAMADEWMYHHFAQIRLSNRESWKHLKAGTIKGLYERSYRRVVDRVWAVSATDKWAARVLAGLPSADLVPNGVDTEFFCPIDVPVVPKSAVFWGNLQFEPNVDASRWFCQEVWPSVLRREPAATLTIMGHRPAPSVQALASLPGVSIKANVEDIRPIVCGHSVVVLPFLSGGGIKNKLLEGAAMGRPIMSTSAVCKDLETDGATIFDVRDTREQWVDGLVALWADDSERARLGAAAREWVARRYSWSTAARTALNGIEDSLRARR